MNFISKRPRENQDLIVRYLKVSLDKLPCRQIIHNGLCQNTAFHQKKVNNRKNPIKTFCTFGNSRPIRPPPPKPRGLRGANLPHCVFQCPVTLRRRKTSAITLLTNAPRSPTDHCYLEGSRTSPVCPGKSNM